MKYACFSLIAFGVLMADNAVAQSFTTDVAPLIESSCIHCHDADTETGLNFEKLSHDLTDPDAFRLWEKVFDRVSKGEMPPESEDRPDPKVLEAALGSLQKDLRATSLAIQKKQGRVPSRRLTQLEYAHTIRDLLSIDGNVSANIPAETNAGGFDTVGATQRLSAVHVESYLKSADEALDVAIALGPQPYRKHVFDISNNQSLKTFEARPLIEGGNNLRVTEDGVALFVENDYLLTSYNCGFPVPEPGYYRITTVAEAYQSDVPMIMKVIKKGPGGAAQLLGSFDRIPGDLEPLEIIAYLTPGDSFYTTLQHEDGRGAKVFAGLSAAGGSKNYKGHGLFVHHQEVEGPINDSWPPPQTKRLLNGTQLVSVKSDEAPQKERFEVKLQDTSIEHVARIIRELAPRIFRRPPRDGELDSFIHLAVPAIEEGRDFVDVVKVPLRSMMSSPEFLLFDSKAGQLDDFALANRLSYFLWKSMPDDELFALAREGKLKYPSVLAMQVDRMLEDEKSQRFVKDFLGQWFQLYKVNATTPDEALYPEYDELLGQAIMTESELFFAELVNEDLSLSNVIDSDFTFVNRRLAEHYGLEGVEGQHYRRIDLPIDGPRGGMLTHAATLKTTANGTTTSPVMRGNFVLNSILGTPPSPPPPNVGSIDPDTRGTTTIREQLDAHREIESCNKCHSKIDPPGFALESFDPIGGFRTKYRAHVDNYIPFSGRPTFKQGLDVDASGVTADGKAFSGIEEFKQLLLEQMDLIAENFVSQLVVYSTGGEIQFADREEVKAILEKTRPDGFPIRTIIHQVVQSQMFRNL